MASDPVCKICLKSSETVEHALLLCDWARATWFGAECQWTQTVETVSSIGKWMVECIKRLRAGGGGDQEKRVEKQQTHKTEIIRRKTNLVKWRPPPENWLKANVDAAFKKDTGTGAIAVVIRNHRGRIMLGFSGKIQARSSIMAEAQAIRQALIIVNNLQMGRILIESDNLKLVQAIKSKTDLGEALAIIQDIRILMETSPEKGVTWTPRNENRLAHAVAKAAEAETLPVSWSIKPPADIQSIIREEVQM
ncbi:hypothetical protein Ahy_A02g006560 isoform A [Arachis hypogaea]|uniref:RNase H type-1 domain-containing protein n=1 Tax=Arachis hypogaea TaxID=3818 RepID=A0A445EA47_ARAHY|nr:hypothetical protein Ahy_A02g006560 isoform A [Arachis hypogaea]